MIKPADQERSNVKTRFVPHSFPERRGCVISHEVVPQWVRVREWSGGQGGQSEDKAFIVISLERIRRGKWAASGS